MYFSKIRKTESCFGIFLSIVMFSMKLLDVHTLWKGKWWSCVIVMNLSLVYEYSCIALKLFRHQLSFDHLIKRPKMIKDDILKQMNVIYLLNFGINDQHFVSWLNYYQKKKFPYYVIYLNVEFLFQEYMYHHHKNWKVRESTINYDWS